MTSIGTRNPFMPPFLEWAQVAWKAGEMAVASAQVIAQRTSRLAFVGSAPGARDQRELVLMGREKGDAVLESVRAAGVHVLMLNQQWVTLAFKQMMSASVALMSIAASRTPAESIEHQEEKFVRDSMAKSVVAASRLSGAGATATRSTMKPVYKRVSANVRRLKKR